MTYFSSKCGRVELALVLLAGALLLAAPLAARTTADEVVGGGTDTAGAQAPEEEAPAEGAGDSEVTAIDTVLRLKSVGGLVHVDVEKSEADQVRMGESLVIDEGILVRGDAVVIGGNLDVYGTVRGDAVVIGGTLHLHETARVDGEAVVVAGRVIKDEGAVVTGQQVSIGVGAEKLLPWSWMRHQQQSAPKRIWGAFKKFFVQVLLSFFLILVFLDLFSRPTQRVAEKIQEDYFRTGLGGVLAVVVTPVSFIVLIISIIGVLLVPVLALVLLIATAMGWVAVSLVVGRTLGNRWFPDVVKPRWQALVGVVLLYVLTFLGKLVMAVGGPLSFIGWTLLIAGYVIVIVALVVGFGAAIMSRLGKPPTAVTITEQNVAVPVAPYDSLGGK